MTSLEIHPVASGSKRTIDTLDTLSESSKRSFIPQRRDSIRTSRHDFEESNLLSALLIEEKQVDVVWKTSCLTHKNEPPHSFVLGKELGKGHFGTVFVLKKTSDKCLKLIDCSAELNMSKEMKACMLHSKVAQNPWIVSLYEFGLIKKRSTLKNLNKTYCAYNIMEICTGGELFDAFIDTKYRDSKTANIACRRLIEALCALEDKKIVHCDIKPENIMLANKSDPTSVRIVDFGGSVKEDSVTGTSTRAYRSPEQLEYPYEVSCKSDVFSMGLVLSLLLYYGAGWGSKTPGFSFLYNWQNSTNEADYMSARKEWLQIILKSKYTPNAIKKMLIEDVTSRALASELRNDSFVIEIVDVEATQLRKLAKDWNTQMLAEWIRDKIDSNAFNKLIRTNLNGRVFLNTERFNKTNSSRFGFNELEISKMLEVRKTYFDIE
jgi:serine/threonine protein kinase